MWGRAARIMWVAPCTLVGLVLGLAVLLVGGRWRPVAGVLEFGLPEREGWRGRVAQRLPFRAITFGHVIVGASLRELERLRRHELVHVRQYERWGLAFFAAYLASSAWQLLHGRRAYWDNRFEVEARRSGDAHDERAGPH